MRHAWRERAYGDNMKRISLTTRIARSYSDAGSSFFISFAPGSLMLFYSSPTISASRVELRMLRLEWPTCMSYPAPTILTELVASREIVGDVMIRCTRNFSFPFPGFDQTFHEYSAEGTRCAQVVLSLRRMPVVPAYGWE